MNPSSFQARQTNVLSRGYATTDREYIDLLRSRAGNLRNRLVVLRTQSLECELDLDLLEREVQTLEERGKNG